MNPGKGALYLIRRRLALTAREIARPYKRLPCFCRHFCFFFRLAGPPNRGQATLSTSLLRPFDLPAPDRCINQPSVRWTGPWHGDCPYAPKSGAEPSN